MAEWNLDIEKWCGKSAERMAGIKKTFAFMLYSSIVKKTPVDTGRARANWNISAGSPDLSVSDETDKGFKNPKSVPDAPGDTPIYISNNLPYISTLEFGGYPKDVKKGTWVKGKGNKNGHYEVRSQGGFSKQAPKGMVGVTAANAGRYLKKALDEKG